ncbi:YtrH family sporulation protein [Clostridium massiliodielmoense]|uniref:YtrH family sporulation protein n=1 Tax=Clostridium massiliodielmoense TaxID=1776385 RepID=UPI0004D91203|nr:YtrH family sporulation protein [Clostridium massiliodielmoense]KEH94592.1 hypothetical protein Z962_09340 [Clostridium botulinum C/D str. BKT12695]NEZ49152.1 hypothetical protein [Clostridium botulinum]
MSNFFTSTIYSFLMSFGIIIGGSFAVGVGAIITNHPPLKTMIEIGENIKIWAVATAIGGTFSSFEILEEGFFRGNINSLIKQVIYILAALIGANMAIGLLRLIEKCGFLWTK